MKSFDPKNRTAQLSYRGRGNPPASHPMTAVGNFFPGLEFNFLNVWKRIFVGIELLESSAEVINVRPEEARNPASRSALERLEKHKRRHKKKSKDKTVYLLAINYVDFDGKPKTIKLLRYAKAPNFPEHDPEEDDPGADN